MNYYGEIVILLKNDNKYDFSIKKRARNVYLSVVILWFRCSSYKRGCPGSETSQVDLFRGFNKLMDGLLLSRTKKVSVAVG